MKAATSSSKPSPARNAASCSVSCCAQFHCDGCGDTFCADHLVSVPDGTDRPLHCCPSCAEECEPLPARTEPARETAAPITIPAEWRKPMCPDCGSINLTCESFNFGTCLETGYQDCGERFRCPDCGATGPADDAEPPAPAHKPVAGAARETTRLPGAASA